MALRLACFLCLLALIAGVSAGPTGAYPCGGSAGSARTLSANVADPERDCSKPSRPVGRNADPISFAFFIGIIVAVLLVPAALVRRKDAPPE